MNVQQTPPMALKYINREMKERPGKLVLSDCGLREIPKERPVQEDFYKTLQEIRKETKD